MAAMAAFTFSSCEDVPSPYNVPSEPETPETPTLENDGSEEKPYTVTDAQTVKAATGKYVTGYIVAYVASGDTKLSNAKFGSAANEENVPTNVLIAASADETDYNKCMPVALPYGDIRTGLNLKDHADYYKQQVTLYGDITTYFGAVGLKETSYAKVGTTEIGTKPGAGGDTPAAGEAKGTGTEADPFNSVAAQNKAKSLSSGEVTEETYYIKGKIQKFANNGEFGAQYGNASFYIADDANSEQFYVYHVYYFGGVKWKEGDQQLKVGDEVVVCAKLTNYKGNTPETNQGGKLISINGKTSGSSETPSTPDTPAAGEGKITINDLTVTLTNGSAAEGESIKVEDISKLSPAANPESITLSDGTVLTFDANGGKSKPAFNTKSNELRLYANNKLTFTAGKTIAKIILTCSKNGSDNAVGNETATVEFSGKTATYINVFTGSTGPGVQLRIKAIEIVYAK